MGYCVSCAKDVKTGKFCPACGRQLLSDAELKTQATVTLEPVASGKSNLAMWAHLAPLLGAVIAPLVYVTLLVLWLPAVLIRSSDKATDFDRRHATESLNFQISLALYIGSALILGVATLSLALVILGPLLVLLAITAVVLNILAAVAANAGREYRYPLTIRFVK